MTFLSSGVADLSALTVSEAQAALVQIDTLVASLMPIRFVLGHVMDRVSQDQQLAEALREPLATGEVCCECDPLDVQMMGIIKTALSTGYTQDFNQGMACLGLCYSARTVVVAGAESAMRRLEDLRLYAGSWSINEPLNADMIQAHERWLADWKMSFDRAVAAVGVNGVSLLNGANDLAGRCFGGATFDLDLATLGLDSLSFNDTASMLNAVESIDHAMRALSLQLLDGGLARQDFLLEPRANALSLETQSLNDCVCLTQVAEGSLLEIRQLLDRIRELCVQSAEGILTEQDRLTIDREIQEHKGHIALISDTASYGGNTLLAGGYHEWLVVPSITPPLVCARQIEMSMDPIRDALAEVGATDVSSAQACVVAMNDTILPGVNLLRATVAARQNWLSYRMQWNDRRAEQINSEEARERDVDFATANGVYSQLQILRQMADLLGDQASFVPYQTEIPPHLFFLGGTNQNTQADLDLERRIARAEELGLGVDNCDPTNVQQSQEYRWLSTGRHDVYTLDLPCMGDCYMARTRVMLAAENIRERMDNLRQYAASVNINGIHSALLPAWVSDWRDGIAGVVASTIFNDQPLVDGGAAVPAGCYADGAFDFRPSTLGIEGIALSDAASFVSAVSTLDVAIRQLDDQLAAAGFTVAGRLQEPLPQNLRTTVADAAGCMSVLGMVDVSLSAVSTMLVRVTELCAQGWGPDIDVELQFLIAEIGRVRAETALFDGQPLLQGGGNWVTFLDETPFTCFDLAVLDLGPVVTGAAQLSAMTENDAMVCEGQSAALLGAAWTLQATAAAYLDRASLEGGAAAAVLSEVAAEWDRENATDIAAVVACVEAPYPGCPGDAAPQPQLCLMLRGVALALLDQTLSTLTGMRDLAGMAGSPSSTDLERSYHQIAFSHRLLAMQHVASLASVNDQLFLNGDSPAWNSCLGNAVYDIRPAGLGIDGLSVATEGSAAAAVTTLDGVISTVDAWRNQVSAL